MAIPHNLEKVSKEDIKYSVDYYGFRGENTDPRQYILRLTGLTNSEFTLQSPYGTQVQEPESAGLDLAHWEAFAQEVSWTNPHYVLAGGEPLRYAHFDELLPLLKASGATLELVTDGLELAAHAGAISSYVDKVQIMLLGFGESHDHHFGEDGAFDQIKAAAEALAAEESGPELSISFTFLPENVEDVEDLLHWADGIGAAVTLQHPQFSSAHLDTLMQETWKKHYEYDFAAGSLPEINELDDSLFGDDVAEICEFVANEFSGDITVKVVPKLSDQEIRNYYSDYDHFFVQEKRVCVKPWQFPTVEPNGNLTLCHNFAIGNISKAGFWKAWNDHQAKHFRRSLMRTERFPMCTRCAFLYRNVDELKDVIQPEPSETTAS